MRRGDVPVDWQAVYQRTQQIRLEVLAKIAREIEIQAHDWDESPGDPDEWTTSPVLHFLKQSAG
jgi:hypothetical protein